MDWSVILWFAARSRRRVVCSTLVFRGYQRSSEGNTLVFSSGGRGVLLFSFEGLRGANKIKKVVPWSNSFFVFFIF